MCCKCDCVICFVPVQGGITAHSVRVPGDALQLPCPSFCQLDDVMWYHDNREVVADNIKYSLTSDNGLVVFNVSMADTGTYDCTSRSVILTSHTVELDAGECTLEYC